MKTPRPACCLPRGRWCWYQVFLKRGLPSPPGWGAAPGAHCSSSHGEGQWKQVSTSSHPPWQTRPPCAPRRSVTFLSYPGIEGLARSAASSPAPLWFSGWGGCGLTLRRPWLIWQGSPMPRAGPAPPAWGNSRTACQSGRLTFTFSREMPPAVAFPHVLPAVTLCALMWALGGPGPQQASPPRCPLRAPWAAARSRPPPPRSP